MKSINKVICAFVLVFSLLVLASCGEKDIDYVAKLKLETSYENKEFVKDGIGKVELYQTVDGDTAWFTSGGIQIKIRFASVDTPESTGQIEPWGKAASKFTGNILEKATTLVLESHNGQKPSLDTTGTRYLAFIWYRMNETSELRNLNLEIVQEGYSISKVSGDAKYQDEFNTATTQALRKKLYVYSSAEDPDFDYSNGPELNIKEVVEKAKDLLGTRVNFEAYVTRRDGNYAYVENAVDNVRYGILVYLGYTATLPQAFKTGNKLRVHGFVQEYNGQYQISGCSYDMFEVGSTSDEYAKYVRVLKTNVPLDPTVITAEQMNTGKINFRTLVTIKNITVEKITTSDTMVDDGFAKEMTLTCKSGDSTIQVRVSEIYVNGVAINESSFRGAKSNIASLTGILDIYNGTYQIRLVSMADVVYK